MAISAVYEAFRWPCGRSPVFPGLGWFVGNKENDRSGQERPVRSKQKAGFPTQKFAQLTRPVLYEKPPLFPRWFAVRTLSLVPRENAVPWRTISEHRIEGGELWPRRVFDLGLGPLTLIVSSGRFLAAHSGLKIDQPWIRRKLGIFGFFGSFLACASEEVCSVPRQRTR